jgi:hypothetical protein
LENGHHGLNDLAEMHVSVEAFGYPHRALNDAYDHYLSVAEVVVVAVLHSVAYYSCSCSYSLADAVVLVHFL